MPAPAWTGSTARHESFADKALSKARRLARNKSLSSWREFAYLCRAAHSLERLGAALPEIGLWPVAVEDKPDDDDLEKSARLVERLLAGNRQSAETRVAGLQLPAAEAALGNDLAGFLRETDSLSRLDALARLEAVDALWLNSLHPGLFDSQTWAKVTLYADRIKEVAKFKAWFYSEGMRAPVPVALGNGEH